MLNMLYKCYAIFAIIGVGKCFISHSFTHLYFSGVVAVNWGRIYIYIYLFIVCPQHGFLFSSCWSWLWTQFGRKDFHCNDGRIWDVAADMSGKGWVGQQWDGSNFYPFELVLKVISKDLKGEKEHYFVGRKSQRQYWTKLPFSHFNPQTLF